MVRSAGVGMRLFMDRVPFCEESPDLAKRGIRTGVTESNQQLVADYVRVDGGVSPELESLMYDPQTSGGLFIGVAADRAEALVAALKDRGVPDAAIVGEVFECPTPIIEFAEAA
jgi:selenide,water dikinase